MKVGRVERLVGFLLASFCNCGEVMAMYAHLAVTGSCLGRVGKKTASVFSVVGSKHPHSCNGWDHGPAQHGQVASEAARSSGAVWAHILFYYCNV